MPCCDCNQPSFVVWLSAFACHRIPFSQTVHYPRHPASLRADDSQAALLRPATGWWRLLPVTLLCSGQVSVPKAGLQKQKVFSGSGTTKFGATPLDIGFQETSPNPPFYCTKQHLDHSVESKLDSCRIIHSHDLPAVATGPIMWFNLLRGLIWY